jgi:N-acetylmuramoyl-L-alanine amidase
MLSAKLLFSVMMVGAVTAPRPGAPALSAVKVHGRSYVSVPVMIRRKGLRMVVNERAGIYTLLDGGHRVVIVPGFSIAEVDGRTVNLRYPAIFHRGELLAPSDLFRYVNRSFSNPGNKAIPLKKVVIDAGHGGRDSGAVGLRGLREKDVALSVALRLKRLLESRGVSVSMTRSGDRFLSLMERSRVANRSGADLFLSIHCNAASNRSAGGVETFALSWGISDSYRAGKAAARHKPSDIVPGAADYVSSTAEKTVFRAHMSEQRRRSYCLARCVQGEMARLVGGQDRGVKLRNFSVLRETYIPAALAEVGFISRPSTESKMRGSSHRQRIAEALAEGVARYARSEKLRLDRIAGKASPGADPTPRYALQGGGTPARRTTTRRRTTRRRTSTRTASRRRSSRSRRSRTLSSSRRRRIAYSSRRRRR